MTAQQQSVGEKWDLAGKVAVVTGGSSGTSTTPAPFSAGTRRSQRVPHDTPRAAGIGKAVVEALVQEGARVVVADLQEPTSPELKSSAIVFAKCDVTRAEGAKKGKSLSCCEGLPVGRWD